MKAVLFRRDKVSFEVNVYAPEGGDAPVDSDSPKKREKAGWNLLQLATLLAALARLVEAVKELFR